MTHEFDTLSLYDSKKDFFASGERSWGCDSSSKISAPGTSSFGKQFMVATTFKEAVIFDVSDEKNINIVQRMKLLNQADAGGKQMVSFSNSSKNPILVTSAKKGESEDARGNISFHCLFVEKEKQEEEEEEEQEEQKEGKPHFKEIQTLLFGADYAPICGRFVPTTSASIDETEYVAAGVGGGKTAAKFKINSDLKKVEKVWETKNLTHGEPFAVDFSRTHLDFAQYAIFGVHGGSFEILLNSDGSYVRRVACCEGGTWLFGLRCLSKIYPQSGGEPELVTAGDTRGVWFVKYQPEVKKKENKKHEKAGGGKIEREALVTHIRFEGSIFELAIDDRQNFLYLASMNSIVYIVSVQLRALVHKIENFRSSVDSCCVSGGNNSCIMTVTNAKDVAICKNPVVKCVVAKNLRVVKIAYRTKSPLWAKSLGQIWNLMRLVALFCPIESSDLTPIRD